MTLHVHHPDNYTRDQKKDVLRGIIADAYEEQARPKRVGHLLPGNPFEMRINDSGARVRLVDVLAQTEALELLAEMVGVVEVGK